MRRPIDEGQMPLLQAKAHQATRQGLTLWAVPHVFSRQVRSGETGPEGCDFVVAFWAMTRRTFGSSPRSPRSPSNAMTNRQLLLRVTVVIAGVTGGEGRQHGHRFLGERRLEDPLQAGAPGLREAAPDL